MDLSVVELKTKNLILIPITRKYSQIILKEFTQEITKYMLPAASNDINVIYSFIDESINEMKKGNNLQLVVIDNKNEEFIGCVGLHNINNDDPELGIWLKKDSHGKGYGYESITELINWAKSNIEYKYLRYPVDKRNIASRRIPEKNDGVIKKEYKTINQSGFELDQYEYWIYKW